MTNTSQRGSIIIYAMLTMAAMLAIGLTLSSLFIAKFRSAAVARNSITALYAADSATEKCLYEARTGNGDGPLVMDNKAQVSIISLAAGQPDISSDCTVLGTDTFSFRATGTYRDVSRTLEISQ